MSVFHWGTPLLVCCPQAEANQCLTQLWVGRVLTVIKIASFNAWCAQCLSTLTLW